MNHVDEDSSATGGSILIVSDDVLHTYLTFNTCTNLQSDTVWISLDKAISLCSLYIAPNSSPSLAVINWGLSATTDPQLIIIGDFNGQ